MLFSVLDLKHLRIRIYKSNDEKKESIWLPYKLTISTNGADFSYSNTEEERMNCV